MVFDSVLVDFTFAFLAGVSSLCHPCAFTLLPGYIAYLVESRTLTRGILSGLIFTSGLITVLAILGALISYMGSFLIRFIPWLQLIVGIAIVIMGLIQIFNFNLPSFSPRIKVKKGFAGLYLFGLGFGLVISGCSAPVFFSIIFYSFISGFQNGILVLASYGFGIGVITIAVSIITLRAKKSMLNKISQYYDWINRITGIILIIAGVYILYIGLSLI